jgi:hypothetical protein
MKYEPPPGMTEFVRVLQRCSAKDAENLLALAFENCAADAITQDLRLRIAAPALLAACKLALATAETGRALDWQALTDAIARVEAPVAIQA